MIRSITLAVLALAILPASAALIGGISVYAGAAQLEGGVDEMDMRVGYLAEHVSDVLPAVSAAMELAAFEPPAQCRGTPKAGTYVVHNVSNPDAHCRAMGTRPAAGRILGCTFGNMQVVTAKGKRAVDLIIVPPTSHPQCAAILRHEFGHANCPAWRG